MPGNPAELFDHSDPEAAGLIDPETKRIHMKLMMARNPVLPPVSVVPSRAQWDTAVRFVTAPQFIASAAGAGSQRQAAGDEAVRSSRGDAFGRLKNVFRSSEGLGKQSGAAATVPGNPLPTLTDPKLVGDALDRYHAAVIANPGTDEVSKAIRAGLLIDIYGLTGIFIKRVMRSPQTRSLGDCALVSSYRELNWAVAEAFGRMTVSDDEMQFDKYKYYSDAIERKLKKQMITMTKHGATVDANVGSRGQLTYLNDRRAMALAVTVVAGKLMIHDDAGNPKPLDTANMTRANGNECHSGRERNLPGGGNAGVAGFALTLNRTLFVHGGHQVCGREGNFYSFYHSSYTGGEDVICTGCLTAVNGELTYINNDSGHYRPKPEQIVLVLDALKAQGVDLKDVRVEYTAVDAAGVAHRHLRFAPMFTADATSRAATMAQRTPQMSVEIREVIERMRQLPFDVKRVADEYAAEKEGMFRKKSEASKATAAKLQALVGPNPASADITAVAGAVQWILGFKSVGKAKMAQLAGGAMPRNLADTLGGFAAWLPADQRPAPGSTLHSRLSEVASRYKDLFDKDDIIWQ